MKIVRCYRHLTLIFIGALFLISTSYGNAIGNENNAGASQAYEALFEKAADEGHVKVIVRLAVPGIEKLTEASRSFRSVSPGQVFPSDAVQADYVLAQAIGSVSDSVLHSLDATEYVVNHTYSTVPFLAMDVSLKALLALQSIPSVLDIIEDLPVKLNENRESQKRPLGNPSFADNTPASANLKLIGADVAWNRGYTGAGWYVAILDTGIRSTHEMFKGKTIVEACFSSSSDCPNNSNEMKGSGSAAHYSDDYAGYGHGTHVAGIAAGNSGTVFGVAKDADIIAVQVFSRFDSYNECYPNTSPCVLTYYSDQLKGLEYVYSIRGSYSISAVNMSLGGGKYDSYCDGDPLKPAIDNLREAGIATVIASGNNGYCGAINAPACISSSVSIGATDYEDYETYFSNWSRTLVDFFAPGYQIYSATPATDTSYDAWDGTSMATPHVAGAWTLMKQCESGGDVTELYNALKETGKKVTTRCGGTDSRPRINVGSAISYLKGILPGPVLSVTTNGTKVTVSWNSVPTAESYVLFYAPYPEFLSEASPQIPMGSKTTISADLPAGSSYTVAVKAYNDAGSSDYSNFESFSITANTTGPMPRD